MNETSDYLEQEIENLNKNLQEAERLYEAEKDLPMKDLIREEIASFKQRVALLTSTKEELVPQPSTNNKQSENDSIEDRDVAIIEIRAGAGGDEAGLFASELYRMYSRYAQNQGWKISEISRHEGGIGNIKEVVAEIKGQGAYTKLRHETGTHRVQRVPTTESSGRIHTSTATVAVLPRVKDVDLEIKTEDLKFDFFRASGHGGQNVNKVETAVRVIHLPTGAIVECQEERSQGQNRERALSLLRSRLYQMMQEQQKATVDELRTQQVGTGDRSEKIRTYNFPQNRVTDHRLKRSWGQVEEILNGSLEAVTEAASKIKGEGNEMDKTDPQLD